jgi:hypothetical protein
LIQKVASNNSNWSRKSKVATLTLGVVAVTSAAAFMNGASKTAPAPTKTPSMFYETMQTGKVREARARIANISIS